MSANSGKYLNFIINIIFIIILGENTSITSIDEGLTQRGRGTRGGRCRGTVAKVREEIDVHFGKYSYDIYYKLLLS